MMKKKKHRTTKNTFPKPPVTRLAIIEGDCNGPFKIATDFCSQQDTEAFDKIYRQWFDHPDTFMWCIESFIIFFKAKYPNRMCVLYSDYIRITKGKVTPSTKEEWELENN